MVAALLPKGDCGGQLRDNCVAGCGAEEGFCLRFHSDPRLSCRLSSWRLMGAFDWLQSLHVDFALQGALYRPPTCFEINSTVSSSGDSLPKTVKSQLILARLRKLGPAPGAVGTRVTTAA